MLFLAAESYYFIYMKIKNRGGTAYHRQKIRGNEIKTTNRAYVFATEEVTFVASRLIEASLLVSKSYLA